MRDKEDVKVLLSLKEEIAEKILTGQKKYEYRQDIIMRIPKSTITCVMYVGSPVYRIVGYFEVDEIIQAKPDIIWNKTQKDAGISKKQFYDYFSFYEKNFVYAYHIKTAFRYDIRYVLRRPLKPPRSFIYIYGDNYKTIKE